LKVPKNSKIGVARLVRKFQQMIKHALYERRDIEYGGQDLEVTGRWETKVAGHSSLVAGELSISFKVSKTPRKQFVVGMNTIDRIRWKVKEQEFRKYFGPFQISIPRRRKTTNHHNRNREKLLRIFGWTCPMSIAAIEDYVHPISVIFPIDRFTIICRI